ncbi:MAG: hypothetical protein ACYDHF_06185 [Candidatus Cryosericum sp.]
MTWTGVKLVIALVATLVVGGTIGGYILDYRHRGQIIEDQKVEIGNLKTEKRVLETTKKTEKRVTTQKLKINRQGEKDEKAIDEALNSRNAARVLNLWKPYELQPQSPEGLHPAANGRRRNPGPALKR